VFSDTVGTVINITTSRELHNGGMIQARENGVYSRESINLKVIIFVEKIYSDKAIKNGFPCGPYWAKRIISQVSNKGININAVTRSERHDLSTFEGDGDVS
jgi:hypothetical protein